MKQLIQLHQQLSLQATAQPPVPLGTRPFNLVVLVQDEWTEIDGLSIDGLSMNGLRKEPLQLHQQLSLQAVAQPQVLTDTRPFTLVLLVKNKRTEIDGLGIDGLSINGMMKQLIQLLQQLAFQAAAQPQVLPDTRPSTLVLLVQNKRTKIDGLSTDGLCLIGLMKRLLQLHRQLALQAATQPQLHPDTRNPEP